MGFTVEDRYLPLSTLTTLKVLHFAKKEIYRPQRHIARVTTCLTLVNKIIKYNLQLNCMSVSSVHYLVVIR